MNTVQIDSAKKCRQTMHGKSHRVDHLVMQQMPTSRTADWNGFDE